MLLGREALEDHSHLPKKANKCSVGAVVSFSYVWQHRHVHVIPIPRESTNSLRHVLRITDIWCPPALHEVTCYAVDVHVYIGLVCTSAWQDMYVQLSLNVGKP